VPAEQLAASRRGRGPRLVLVHGFTQTARSWDPLAEHLADRHEVVAVDAPGHGGSATIEADLSTGATMLGATGGRATYVGYSMGGRLCLHLAVERPDLVERLVLISATGGVDDAGQRAARRQADEALAASLERDGVELFLARWVAQPMFAGLADPGLDDRRRNTVPGLASSLRLAGTGTQLPLWSRLSSIDVPVLLVAGRLDPKFVAAAGRMATILPHPTVAIVEGAGHTVHLERRDEFRELLDEWLAATAADQPGIDQ
jgi:2-succinyl-6-hydroxy-2,4-cyclohexadiene-1-carboxylate synthase